MGKYKRRNGNGKKAIVKRGKRNGELSVKELIFIEEYLLNDFNRTRAYMIAYPNSNIKTAESAGCALMKKHRVMCEIDRRITSMFEKLEVSNEMLIASYVNQAYYDERSFFVDGVFVGINQLNIAQQACIESIEMEDVWKDVTTGKGKDKCTIRVLVGKKTKVKFYSRKAAMDALAKYKGLIRDGNNTIIFGDNKTEVTITAAKQLKEELGADGVIKLNRLLSKADSN